MAEGGNEREMDFRAEGLTVRMTTHLKNSLCNRYVCDK